MNKTKFYLAGILLSGFIFLGGCTAADKLVNFATNSGEVNAGSVSLNQSSGTLSKGQTVKVFDIVAKGGAIKIILNSPFTRLIPFGC